MLKNVIVSPAQALLLLGGVVGIPVGVVFAVDASLRETKEEPVFLESRDSGVSTVVWAAEHPPPPLQIVVDGTVLCSLSDVEWRALAHELCNSKPSMLEPRDDPGPDPDSECWPGFTTQCFSGDCYCLKLESR